MLILGISAFYHDSAVALVDDGQLVFAAHEERYTRIKHDSQFPARALEAAIKFAGSKKPEYIIFYEKPIQKFHRIFENLLYGWPYGYEQFIIAIKEWFSGGKINHSKLLKGYLEKISGGMLKDVPIKFSSHHLSHASSAYYCSSFFLENKSSLVYVSDAVGEWETASVFMGKDGKLTQLEALMYPHSLGMFYSAFTAFLGFKVNSGEYKLMGLAPYGDPIFHLKILEEFFEPSDDGIRLNLKRFAYLSKLKMFDSSFEEIFKISPRSPNGEIAKIHCDIAASVQSVLNLKVLEQISKITDKYGIKNICLAGGVSLNCTTNSHIGNKLKDLEIFVQPAAGDAGGAAGAALAFAHHAAKPDNSSHSFKAFTPYLGSEYSTDELKFVLKKLGIKFNLLSDFGPDKIAKALDQGAIVGLHCSRSEYGPRALGNRSIIASPFGADAQKYINHKIKFREGFRPFAPVVLHEFVSQYFDVNSNLNYDHMLFTAPVLGAYLEKVNYISFNLNNQMKRVKSPIPAVTHIDGSARIQTLKPNTNPLLESILVEFKTLTGYAVLVNTSFNIRGEPPVETPIDALKTFLASELDYLVCGDVVISRAESKIPSKDFILGLEDD